MNSTVDALRRLMAAMAAWPDGQPLPAQVREALEALSDEIECLEDNLEAFVELRTMVAEARQQGRALIETVPVVLLERLLLGGADHD